MANQEYISETSERLPILDYRERIIDSVESNPVTVISAETGAGKSTQVPQMLAEQGYEVIITQPRRVAAGALASRVASEMSEELGGRVGYRTGHDKQVSSKTDITFCTDGLQLVRELVGGHEGDSKKRVLILDEVHEWNTNIETLVAWSKLQAEADSNFRVVLMSATLEAQELTDFFSEYSGSPIKVPGRQFSVERQEQIVDENSVFAKTSEVTRALAMNGKNILVFMPGKKEIEDHIRDLKRSGVDATHDILPLHGGLEKSEQNSIFNDSGRPKIVVATNIAQTSITIEDIDAVVDTGLERRIEVRDGVEGLFLRPISQADCEQRAGRAGRTREGEYVLVGSSLESRPEYATAEILRSRLDKTVLRLARAGIDAGELEFYHQPPKNEIIRAREALYNLGALDSTGDITHLGHEIDKLPVEVHFARMLVEAKRLGVIEEMTAIIAVLEIGGIIDRKNPHWRSLTAESESDALANYDLLRSASNLTAGEMRDSGLHVKNARRALSIYKELSKRLGFNTSVKQLPPLDSDTRKSVLNAILAGSVDHLYHYEYGGYQGRGANNGTARQKARESVVSGSPEWVIGNPFDLSFTNRRGRQQTLNLLQEVTVVDPLELIRFAPHLAERRENSTRYDSNKDAVITSVELHFNGHILGAVDEDVTHLHPEVLTEGRIVNCWREYLQSDDKLTLEQKDSDTLAPDEVEIYGFIFGTHPETGKSLVGYVSYQVDAWYYSTVKPTYVRSLSEAQKMRKNTLNFLNNRLRHKYEAPQNEAEKNKRTQDEMTRMRNAVSLERQREERVEIELRLKAEEEERLAKLAAAETRRKELLPILDAVEQSDALYGEPLDIEQAAEIANFADDTCEQIGLDRSIELLNSIDRAPFGRARKQERLWNIAPWLGDTELGRKLLGFTRARDLDAWVVGSLARLKHRRNMTTASTSRDNDSPSEIDPELSMDDQISALANFFNNR